MSARTTTSLGFAVSAAALLGTVGCAVTHMQVPAPVLATPAWSIAGYTEQSVREPDFTIAGRTVQTLVRVRRPLTNTSASNQSSGARGYRFELQAAGETLRAECSETAAPKELWLLRFGKGQVQLACSCRAGAQVRASLSLVEEQGKARLADGTELSVAGVHARADGTQTRALLGYTLSGSRGTGAVERTGPGRAWPWPGIAAGAATDLSCLYAALLLYRPDP